MAGRAQVDAPVHKGRSRGSVFLEVALSLRLPLHQTRTLPARRTSLGGRDFATGEYLPQIIRINRLDQVAIEAGLAGAAAIFVLAEAGHRHQERVLRLRLM